MSNYIRAELSSDSCATALGITVRSPSPVLALCRKLIESSTYTPETPLDAYRGNTLCLRVLGIGEAAQLGMSVSATGASILKPRQAMAGGPTIEPE